MNSLSMNRLLFRCVLLPLVVQLLYAVQVHAQLQATVPYVNDDSVGVISGRYPSELESPSTRSPTLNVGFGYDPRSGKYDGVLGGPGDLWNFVSVGTTAKDFLRNSDTTPSSARLRVSRHDGVWGVKGHEGIFHGYIYDNCQCKDLKTTFLDLESGRYRAHVYAHGDAPNQNARIEVVVGDESIGSKATANDGTFGYRSLKMREGIQFVAFEFDVRAGQDVSFISHRDGSGYSMFNAIQIATVDK